jgi:hypothetical protein
MHRHLASAVEIFFIAGLLSSGLFLAREIAFTKDTLSRIAGSKSDKGPVAIEAREVYVGESTTLAQLLVSRRTRVCVELDGSAACPSTGGLTAVELCPGAACAGREDFSITKGGFRAIRLLTRAVQRHRAVFVGHFGIVTPVAR